MAETTSAEFSPIITILYVAMWTYAVWTVAKIRFVWTRTEDGAEFVAGLRGETHPSVPQPGYSETVPFPSELTEQHASALADARARSLLAANDVFLAYGVAAYRMPDGVIHVPMNEASPRHPPGAEVGRANLRLVTRYHEDRTHTREPTVSDFSPYRKDRR